MSSWRSSCWILALGAALAGQPAWAVVDVADKREDPTRPEQWVASSSAANLAIPTLNSVLIGNGRKLAVIDGQVLAEGEQHSGIKLWKVQADRVVVSLAGGARMTLRLDNKVINKEVR